MKTKKGLLLTLVVAISLGFSTKILASNSGDECPDRCTTTDDAPKCCQTEGGSTYFGVIDIEEDPE